MSWLKEHHVVFSLLVPGITVMSAAGTVSADYVFGEPVDMGKQINTPYTDAAASISPNGLELYYCSTRPPSTGWDDLDLYVAKRTSLDDDWGEPVRLPAPLNADGASALFPFLTQDGLALYFNCNRPGGYGGFDLWVARRATLDSPWGKPVNVGPPVNSQYDEHRVAVFNDEREIYFSDMELLRPGGYGMADVYVSTRASKTDPWGEPVNLGPMINGPDWDQGPTYIFPDGLRAYFTTYFREGGAGGGDIWIITRPSPTAPWDTIIPLGPPLNSIHPDDWDVEVVLCPLASMAYMHSYRPEGYGDWDLWQAPLIPVVDFNGDKAVDLADVQALLDHWGTSDSLYDIGPTPVGDGIVDAQDLTVLAQHLFEEPAPPTPRISYGSFTEGPAGTFTMTDHSRDIWSFADGFHFAYKTLSGPGSIIARVDSLTNTNPWAKAGVMIRETLDARSKNAFVGVSAENGVVFNGRDEANPGSFWGGNQTEITVPHWVKLERDAQGNFTASHSDDGTTWQPIPDVVPANIPMNADVYVGLALTSVNMHATCEAVFSNVSITGTVGSQWANQDVGIFAQP